MSSYEEYIQQGLGGEAPLKVILCGNVEEAEKDKIGVVSVVYATEKKEWAEQKIRELTKAHPAVLYGLQCTPGCGFDRTFSLSVHCNQQGGFGVKNIMDGEIYKKISLKHFIISLKVSWFSW